MKTRQFESARASLPISQNFESKVMGVERNGGIYNLRGESSELKPRAQPPVGRRERRPHSNSTSTSLFAG